MYRDRYVSYIMLCSGLEPIEAQFISVNVGLQVKMGPVFLQSHYIRRVRAGTIENDCNTFASDKFDHKFHSGGEVGLEKQTLHSLSFSNIMFVTVNTKATQKRSKLIPFLGSNRKYRITAGLRRSKKQL